MNAAVPFPENQVKAVISTGKCFALSRIFLMLRHSGEQVIGDTNIKNSFGRIGCDINEIIVIRHTFEILSTMDRWSLLNFKSTLYDKKTY